MTNCSCATQPFASLGAMVRRLAIVIALLLALPASAQAASLTVNGTAC